MRLYAGIPPNSEMIAGVVTSEKIIIRIAVYFMISVYPFSGKIPDIFNSACDWECELGILFSYLLFK